MSLKHFCTYLSWEIAFLSLLTALEIPKKPIIRDHNRHLDAHRKKNLMQAKEEPSGRIQGIVLDEENLIMIKPFVKLRQGGKDLEQCHTNSKHNGFFEIQCYGPEISGRVEFVYGKAEKDENHEIWTEDAKFLFKTASPESESHLEAHAAINQFHTQYYKKILYLHYKSYGPYMFAYRIYGHVLRMGMVTHEGGEPVPTPVILRENGDDECKERCPWIHMEHTCEHEHIVNKIPFDLEINDETGEFRITIRNGYGLDPEQRSHSGLTNYGKLNIAVAKNKTEKEEGKYEVYTIDVLDTLKMLEQNNKVLHLYVDKKSMSYEPRGIKEPKMHALRFQFKVEGGSENSCLTLEHMSGNKEDLTWLNFKDKAGNDMHTAGALAAPEHGHNVVEVLFYPTMADEFTIIIRCEIDEDKTEQHGHIQQYHEHVDEHGPEECKTMEYRYETSFSNLTEEGIGVDAPGGARFAYLLTVPTMRPSIEWEPVVLTQPKKHMIQFQVRKVDDPDQPEHKNKCGMLEKNPRENGDFPWLHFVDSAGKELNVAKHVIPLNFNNANIVGVEFAETTIDEFKIIIDCSYVDHEGNFQEFKIHYDTAFSQLINEGFRENAPGNVMYSYLLTAPEKADEIKWTKTLSKSVSKKDSVHHHRGFNKERLTGKNHHSKN